MAVYYKAHSHIINNGAVDDAAASSLTHKQRKTNNNNGHHTPHIHHKGTQHHRREQLLAGWERVLLQNERTATPPRRGSNERRPKGRRSFDVPWAVGNFFFFSFHYFVANKGFYTGFIYVTTTLQARGRDDEAAKGRPTTTQRRGDNERRKGKKAQGTSSTSLGP